MESSDLLPAPVDVALVIDTLGRGGAERVLVSIANGLDRHRFRPHLIATREPGVLAASLAPDVRVHSLGRRSRADLHAIIRFAALLDAERIRIVHTHTRTAAYFARLARPLSRSPWLHVAHDHHGPVERSIPFRMADRLFLRGVDYYLGVSSALVSYARRSIGLSEERTEHLFNGIEVPAPRGTPKAARFTVVQVARIRPEKDQQMALAVAEQLRKVIPDLHWLCVGRLVGDYASACIAQAESAGLGGTVEFVGEQADVQALLERAHVGVLTSRFEGLPISLLEYMAAGLPVVTTDVGDCGSVIRASGGGALVAPGDVRGFTGALAALAGDPARASRWGADNRAFVARRHGVQAMVHRVEEVYATLLAAAAA